MDDNVRRAQARLDDALFACLDRLHESDHDWQAALTEALAETQPYIAALRRAAEGQPSEIAEQYRKTADELAGKVGYFVMALGRYRERGSNA